ncbi:MAG TPA: hypothetical protein VMB71_07320 [Acetobacteraceae bacterium]|nr:hypothetical protein [Acetobacteraceae bacterium]
MSTRIAYAMARFQATCTITVAAAMLVATFERCAAAGPPECPPWGCLPVSCDMQDSSTTIQTCKNAILSDDRQLRFWQGYMSEHKGWKEHYVRVLTPLEQNRAKAVKVLGELRRRMDASGRVCFPSGDRAHFQCYVVGDPSDRDQKVDAAK